MPHALPWSVNSWTRWLLWTAVLLAPGGLLLVPFLALDASRSRKPMGTASRMQDPAASHATDA